MQFLDFSVKRSMTYVCALNKYFIILSCKSKTLTLHKMDHWIQVALTDYAMQ